MRSLILVLALALAPTAAVAQPADQLSGKWSGMLVGGQEDLAVELNVSETSGMFRFVPKVNQLRQNPCLGKELPMKVTSQTATEVKAKVEGSSILKGCFDASLTLKSSDGKSLEGNVSGGRVLKLNR
jgi:hypothetical protein